MTAPSLPAVRATIATRQVADLDALIDAAQKARFAAKAGVLFGSPAGYALVNAMHDLTGVDGLYDFAGDVAHDAGIDHEPHWRDTVRMAGFVRDMLAKGRA